MAYSTQEQIEAILGRDLTASEIASLPGLQATVDGWILSQVGEGYSSTPGTRFYDVDGSVISIDPVRSVSSVNVVDANDQIVSEYTDGTEYLLGPYNSDVKTYIEKIYAVDAWWDWDDAWWIANMYRPRRVAVTGTFGYGDSAPSAVQDLSAYLAGLMLTSQSYSNAVAASGNKKSESIEGYSITWDTGSSNRVTVSLDDLLESDARVQMALAAIGGDSTEVYI